MRCVRVSGSPGSIGALARPAALRLPALRLPLPPRLPATPSTPSAGRRLLCLHPLLAGRPSGAQGVRGRRRRLGLLVVVQRGSGHLRRGGGHRGGLGDPAEPQGPEVGGLGHLVIQLVGWADQGAGGGLQLEGGLLSFCPLLLLLLLLLLLFIILILKQSADLDE